MPVEERRAKFTFLYVGGQLHLNPHAAREAGLAVELPGAAGVPGDGDATAGDPGSWREEAGPVKRRRRARRGRAAEGQYCDPGTGTMTPPRVAEPQRGLGSPPRRRKASAPTLRGRKGDAASQFLVFCQRHRDEVGAGTRWVPWAWAWGGGAPALSVSKASARAGSDLTGSSVTGAGPPAWAALC